MSSKSRNRQQVFPWSFKRFDADGNVQVQGKYAFEQPVLVESITSSNSGKKAFNYCLHRQVRRQLTPASFKYKWVGGALDGQTFEQYSNYPGEFDETLPLIPFDFPSGFIGRSFQAMQPNLRSDLSIPNFLIEMKDLKGMIESLARGLTLQGTKAASYLARNGVKRGRPLSNSQRASNAHLTYSFGIAPLVSDIIQLQEAVNKFVSDYNKFVDDMGKVQVKHYQETHNVSESEVVLFTGAYNRHTAEASSCRVKYVATMKYVYFHSGSRRKLNPADYFLPYYGFRAQNLLSVAWQAMPFSFVIDWVLKIGDLIDNQSGSALSVDVVVLDYCISQHYERTFKYFLKTRPDVSSMTMEPSDQLLVETKCEFYERTPVKPSVASTSWVLPRVDGMSIRELLLGASLLNMRR